MRQRNPIRIETGTSPGRLRQAAASPIAAQTHLLARAMKSSIRKIAAPTEIDYAIFLEIAR